MLASQWTGRFGGVPPFDAVNPSAFTESFKQAIETAKAEIQSIATSSEAPTFDNTIVAMEKSAAVLQKLSVLFGVHTNNLNVGPVKEAEQAVRPMLAEYDDCIVQNVALFARVKAINDQAASLQLTSEQKRLLQERFREFTRNGALVDASGKERLSQINQRLASLFTSFGQNILEEEKSVIFVDTVEELDGLQESQIKSLAQAAKQLGQEGKYAIQNTRSSVEPFLHYAKNRALRERVWRSFINRGANEGANNNYAIITEMVKLRAERAKLLGFASHAHWRVEPEMAQTPANAMQLLQEVWPKAKERVQEEVKDMLEVAKEDGVTEIEPWDYRFYSEKVRLARYDLDFNEVVPYLDAERLREGMFWAAGTIYGLTFLPVTDVPVFHEDVRVWEVQNTADGSHIGLFYFDPYCREGKRSGAWMMAYRSQNLLLGDTSIVSNNSNFVKADPSLISWDDAVTMFHEFGHALHGLLSKVTYPTLSGTNVARDFVEFPSQLNEHWLETTELLEKYARHTTTKEVIPQELLAKIKRASNFNQGFKTVEFLSCALLDMMIHMKPDGDLSDPAAFEDAALKEIGMPKEIVMRHRLAHFAHIFSTDSYSAGYYSYMWADTLVADAAEAFQQSPGGFYDKEVAARYLRCVLSAGNSVEAAQAFEAFRGRRVDTSALMRKRGFI